MFHRWNSYIQILILALTLPMIAEEFAPSSAVIDPDLSDEQSLVSVVRHSYQQLEKYSGVDGQGLSFELYDFRTARNSEFDTITWSDVHTLEGGEEIFLSRRVERNDVGSFVHYRPSWKDSSYVASPETDQLHATLTYQDVLDEMAANGTVNEGLEALTSYTVLVELDGRSRVYRAAFLWYVDSEGGLSHLEVQDYITGGVETALSEELAIRPQGLPAMPQGLPAMPQGLPAMPQGDQQDAIIDLGGSTQEKIDVACEDRPFPSINADLSASGMSFHSSGSHQILTQGYQLRCFCDSDCTQDATLVQGSETPLEIGTITGNACHRISGVSIEIGCDTNKPLATNNPAQCSYAIAAGWKHCQKNFGVCTCNPGSVTIGASGSGGNVGFTFSAPSGTMTLKKSNTFSCNTCTLEEENDNGPNSPVLINLDGDGFSLTGFEDPVWFDIDADGKLDEVGWTAAESGDAFLALDRNGNGIIDDGSELFGDATTETASSSEVENGYSALALFDYEMMGGNGDGVITAEDEVFSSLRLWIDRDHDGFSQAEELHTLDDYDIAVLGLEFKDSLRTDDNGNEFRYFSFVKFNDGSRARTVDVFLVTKSYKDMPIVQFATQV